MSFPYQTTMTFFSGNSQDAYNLTVVHWNTTLTQSNRDTWALNRFDVRDFTGEKTFYDYVMRLFGISNSNIDRYSTFTLNAPSGWDFVNRGTLSWTLL